MSIRWLEFACIMFCDLGSSIFACAIKATLAMTALYRYFVAAFASDGHIRFFLDLLRQPDAALEKAQRLACQSIGAISRQFGALKFDSGDTTAQQQLTISEEIGQLKVCIDVFMLLARFHSTICHGGLCCHTRALIHILIGERNLFVVLNV